MNINVLMHHLHKQLTGEKLQGWVRGLTLLQLKFNGISVIEFDGSRAKLILSPFEKPTFIVNIWILMYITLTLPIVAPGIEQFSQLF